MHHYTYSEKYHNDLGLAPEQKSNTDASDLLYDNTNSSNSLIDGTWRQSNSLKDKKLFKSSITEDDDPLIDRKSKVITSKQSTFAYNQMDKFNTDNNTSASKS